MLVRSLFRKQLTSIITYSYQLQREPVEQHFANNYKSARDQIKKISTQFNMNKQQSRRAFHFFPEVFKPESKQFNLFKQRVQWVKQFKNSNDQKGLGRVLQKNLFYSNYLAFQFTKEQFEGFVAAVNKYFANQAQIQKILTQCPNLINPKLNQILEQKVGLLTDFLSISQQQAMKVFQTTPFLLPASKKKLKDSIVALHRAYGLSKQQIVQQMKSMGQIFLLGGPPLVDLHRIPIRWGLNKTETKEAFLKNPLLFFNYPYDVLPYKRRILRYLNFTTQMARQMILKHPQILIWSIRSLQQKALFITNRMQINTDIKTIQLLTFNFNKTLRPRGQILIKSKTTYNNDNIVSFMKLSDQQFCNKINVPIQKLTEQKAKYPVSLQMDFRKSKLLGIIGARQKFIKLASVYQH